MFTDCSALLLKNPAQRNYGVAVTDVDGDGAFEFVVAGFGYPNLALKWNQAGLKNIADDILADSYDQAIGLAAGDIDGDGREEIYVLNTDTFMGPKQFGDRLFARRGNGWQDLFALQENQAALNLTAGRSVAAVDRDGDGRYGFFVANYGGPMRLYELDAQNRLRDVAAAANLNFITGGRGIVAQPLVSERMDIFMTNERGSNFLFVNRGDGTFDEISRDAGIHDPREHGRGVAALDPDGDGLFDLVYGNWESSHRLFAQTAPGEFTDIAPTDMARPSPVRTVIAADFDNDGALEIFFNNIGAPNRLFGWRDGRWTPLTLGDALEPYGLGTGAAVCDIDADGRLELLIAHGEIDAQPLSLYRSTQSDNAWLRVLPLTRYGAPARGAVVMLYAGGRAQVRAIDAGSGYLCQMEPTAHFGLGRTEHVDKLVVRWLDGTQTTLTDLDANQLIRVPYPTS